VWIMATREDTSKLLLLESVCKETGTSGLLIVKYLTLDSPHTPTFYLLPKIHKLGNQGRLIVGSYNSPTERISALVTPSFNHMFKCCLSIYATPTTS